MSSIPRMIKLQSLMMDKLFSHKLTSMEWKDVTLQQYSTLRDLPSWETWDFDTISKSSNLQLMGML